jgi:hypothetical protein
VSVLIAWFIVLMLTVIPAKGAEPGYVEGIEGPCPYNRELSADDVRCRPRPLPAHVRERLRRERDEYEAKRKK